MKLFKILCIFAIFSFIVSGCGIKKNEIVLKSKMTGNIIEVNVENNSIVKNGEILAVIDTSSHQQKLDELTQKLENLQNNFKISQDDLYKIKAIYKKTNDDIKSSKLALDIANSDYILYKNAYKDGSVTSKDFMNAKNNLTIASKKYKKAIDRNNEVNKELENIISKNEYQNSEIEQLTEEIKGLQAIVSSGTIISPTDGKIKNLKIKPDNHINSGDEILTIVQN